MAVHRSILVNKFSFCSILFSFLIVFSIFQLPLAESNLSVDNDKFSSSFYSENEHSQNISGANNLDHEGLNNYLAPYNLTISFNGDNLRVNSNLSRAFIENNDLQIYFPEINEEIIVGLEVTPNTLPCRAALNQSWNTGAEYTYKLIHLASSDYRLIGNGHYYLNDDGSENISMNLFFPSRNLRIMASSSISTESVLLNSEISYIVEQYDGNDQLAQFQLNRFVNNVDVHQIELSTIRLVILFHDRTITDLGALCTMIEQSNTYFRYYGIYFQIEGLKSVGQGNWNSNPSVDCDNGLLSEIQNEVTRSKKKGTTHFGEKFDSRAYFFWDYLHNDNTASPAERNHDGLNWNNVRNSEKLGCAWVPTHIDDDLIGSSWIRIIPNIGDYHYFLYYHSILIAHELGHLLGGEHSHASGSYQSSSSGGANCYGDGNDDNHTHGGPLEEGKYQSILFEGMRNDLDCFGSFPYFTNTSLHNMINRGTVNHLQFRLIQPDWSRISASQRITFDLRNTIDHHLNHDIIYLNASHQASVMMNQSWAKLEIEYWYLIIERDVNLQNEDELIWRIAFSYIITKSDYNFQPEYYRIVQFFTAMRAIDFDANSYHLDSLEGYYNYSRIIYNIQNSQFEYNGYPFRNNLTECNITFHNGHSEISWNSRIYMDKKYYGDYDYGNSVIDFGFHQNVGSNNLGHSIWIAWPAYSIQEMMPGMSIQYGEFAKFGLEWYQN